MNFFYDKKTKLIYIILVILLGIISITYNLLSWYLSEVTPKLNLVVEQKIEKITYEIITDKLNNELIKKDSLDSLLLVTKNNEGEILMVDYNLEEAYKVNNEINDMIKTSLLNLETGNLKNTDFKSGENSIYIEEPLFINSDYVIISSLGPKVPVKIDFVGVLITNLKNEITNYGLNNVLNEIFVSVEVSILITTPVNYKKLNFEYDILIDATLINGRVPMIYGPGITSESNIVNSSLE